MDASRDMRSGTRNGCGRGTCPCEGSPRRLFVPLNKTAVVWRVLLTYATTTCATVALINLAGSAGTRAGLGLLAITLPRIFLGAALLFEQAPPLEVDAWAGLRVRRPAILGEAFGLGGRAVVVGWDEVERWEVASANLAMGVPCPFGGSVLRVVLRRPEAFAAEHGWLWGRIRFGWKAFRHGTPLVVSDAVLRQSVREIAGFMSKVRPGVEGAPNGPGDFEVPLSALPFAAVVQ